MIDRSISSHRRTLAVAVASLIALGISFPVSAQGAGPNGGTVVVSEGHPVELVSNGTELVFFITDESAKPLETEKLSARAYVQADGKTETVQLKPQTPNKLVGSLKSPLAKGAKIMLSTKVHGHTLQARFTQ